MSSLVVTLTYPLQPNAELLTTLGEQFEARDASIAYIPHTGTEVTVWLDDADLLSAASLAAERVSDVLDADPIAVEVTSAAEHERQGAGLCGDPSRLGRSRD